jgi:hypothetical protein
MATEMGEYLVGAYLKFELRCGVVDYNARPPGGGLQGLGELDVIGFDFPSRRAYLCEVTTHLDGLQIGKGLADTMSKIKDKHRRQRSYAEAYLKEFSPSFMFWSPVVRSGISIELQKIEGLELFINGAYTAAIDRLRLQARWSTADANNPAFRVLQIIENLRSAPQSPAVTPVPPGAATLRG